MSITTERRREISEELYLLLRECVEEAKKYCGNSPGFVRISTTVERPTNGIDSSNDVLAIEVLTNNPQQDVFEQKLVHCLGSKHYFGEEVSVAKEEVKAIAPDAVDGSYIPKGFLNHLLNDYGRRRGFLL